MLVRFLSRDDIASNDGVVCVIDVISAFTTASWLFAQNSTSIIVAESIDQARTLKNKDPNLCLIGEERGEPIEGFEYANDLTQFQGVDFTGRSCVMKTSSGTVGLIANRNARHLLAASFCNAKATADYIALLAPTSVNFIITNNFKSAEDATCAGYICEHLFTNKCLEKSSYCNIINASRYGEDTRKNGTGEMNYVSEADRFDFVMIGYRKNGIIEILQRTMPRDEKKQ